MQLIEQLTTVAAEYARARKLSAARVSTLLFNDGKRLGQISGGADVATKTHERAMQWLSDHWPDDAEWPENVRRPERAGAAA